MRELKGEKKKLFGKSFFIYPSFSFSINVTADNCSQRTGEGGGELWGGGRGALLVVNFCPTTIFLYKNCYQKGRYYPCNMVETWANLKLPLVIEIIRFAYEPIKGINKWNARMKKKSVSVWMMTQRMNHCNQNRILTVKVYYRGNYGNKIINKQKSTNQIKHKILRTD